MPKSLADGHRKFIVLDEEPNIPATPTVTELAAGIDMSCDVLDSDFRFSPTASDQLNEKPLCVPTNAVDFGSSNFEGSITVFRYFDDTDHQIDDTEDVSYQTVKVKGTRLWGYLIERDRPATDAAVAGDDISVWMEFITDQPQIPTTGGGYIKRTIPLGPQNGGTDTKVLAGA